MSTKIVLVIIMLPSVLLTLPVNVDRSSPPMTLISPVDWSFCEDKKEVDIIYVVQVQRVNQGTKLIWWLIKKNIATCFFF